MMIHTAPRLRLYKHTRSVLASKTHDHTMTVRSQTSDSHLMTHSAPRLRLSAHDQFSSSHTRGSACMPGALSDTAALADRATSLLQRSCSARDEGRCVCKRAVVQCHGATTADGACGLDSSFAMHGWLGCGSAVATNGCLAKLHLSLPSTAWYSSLLPRSSADLVDPLLTFCGAR